MGYYVEISGPGIWKALNEWVGQWPPMAPHAHDHLVHEEGVAACVHLLMNPKLFLRHAVHGG
jgi:hypothetical protein